MKLSAKAIFIGLIVDIASTIIISAILGIILVIVIQIKEGVISFDTISLYEANAAYYLTRLFVSLFVTVLAGYITRKLSNQNKILNSIAVGAFSTILRVFLLISKCPAWYIILSLIFIIPCAYIGGIIAKRKFESQY